MTCRRAQCISETEGFLQELLSSLGIGDDRKEWLGLLFIASLSTSIILQEEGQEDKPFNWREEMIYVFCTGKHSSQDTEVEMSSGLAELCVQVSVRSPSLSIEQTVHHLDSKEFSSEVLRS